MARSLEIRVHVGYAACGFVCGAAGFGEEKQESAQSTAGLRAARYFARGNFGRKKRTFTLPWEQWLHGPMRAKVADELRGYYAGTERAR